MLTFLQSSATKLMKEFLERESNCIKMKWILDLITLLYPVIKMCYVEISVVSYMILYPFKSIRIHHLIKTQNIRIKNSEEKLKD